MRLDPLVIYYLVMLFFQTIHIFEEIGFGVYEVVGSLKKYLIVASFLILLGYLPLFLLLMGITRGYYLAYLTSFIAIGNGIVHLFGFIKTKSFRGTLGAGIFSGIPLSISGALVLVQLLSKI